MDEKIIKTRLSILKESLDELDSIINSLQITSNRLKTEIHFPSTDFNVKFQVKIPSDFGRKKLGDIYGKKEKTETFNRKRSNWTKRNLENKLKKELSPTGKGTRIGPQ